MQSTARLSLPAHPESAGRARRFLRDHARLDGMRHAEVDLLVTELIANVIAHSSAEELELTFEQDPDRGLVVTVSNSFPSPLDGVKPGVGFLCLDKVSRSWGHSHDGERVSIWFAVRTPGAMSVSPDRTDDDLIAHMQEDPASYSDELSRRHADLASSIARRYRGKGIDDDDLNQVGQMALLKAIQRYDPTLGDLRAYAAVTIAGELKKLLRDKAWSVRVPRSLQEDVLRVGRGAEDLGHRLGRPPEPPELAEHLGMELGAVLDALEARQAYSSTSVDAPADPTGLTLLDRLESEDPGLLLAHERVMVEEAAAQLPERQREILHLRFNEDLTQSEIAERVGLSQMHVSRLLSASFEEMRNMISGTN